LSLKADATQAEKVRHYKTVIRTYVDAIRRKDVDAICSLYAEDAQVHDPIGVRDIRGGKAIREFYEGVVTRAYLAITGPICGSAINAAAVPIRAYVPGFEIDVISVAEFDDAGLILNYTAYWAADDKHAVS
jgi:hypothetical protein